MVDMPEQRIEKNKAPSGELEHTTKWLGFDLRRQATTQRPQSGPIGPLKVALAGVGMENVAGVGENVADAGENVAGVGMENVAGVGVGVVRQLQLEKENVAVVGMENVAGVGVEIV